MVGSTLPSLDMTDDTLLLLERTDGSRWDEAGASESATEGFTRFVGVARELDDEASDEASV